MKRNLLLLGLVMFFCGIFNSMAQTVNGPQAFDTYLETFDNGQAPGWTPLSGSWAIKPNDLVGTGGDWYAMTQGAYMIHSIYDNATFENYAINAIAHRRECLPHIRQSGIRKLHAVASAERYAMQKCHFGGITRTSRLPFQRE